MAAAAARSRELEAGTFAQGSTIGDVMELPLVNSDYSDMPGRLANACGLRISRWSFLFDGPAALGRRPRPGRPICNGALGCPSGSA
jgi:hypothetical protein